MRSTSRRQRWWVGPAPVSDAASLASTPLLSLTLLRTGPLLCPPCSQDAGRYGVYGGSTVLQRAARGWLGTVAGWVGWGRHAPVAVAAFPLDGALTAANLARHPAHGPLLAELQQLGLADERAVVMLHLAVERARHRQGGAGPLAPWLALLPAAFGTTQHFSELDLQWLRGTTLHRATRCAVQGAAGGRGLWRAVHSCGGRRKSQTHLPAPLLQAATEEPARGVGAPGAGGAPAGTGERAGRGAHPGRLGVGQLCLLVRWRKEGVTGRRRGTGPAKDAAAALQRRAACCQAPHPALTPTALSLTAPPPSPPPFPQVSCHRLPGT